MRGRRHRRGGPVQPPGRWTRLPSRGLRGTHRDRARDAGDHHPLLVLVRHLRVRRLLVRALRVGRRDGRAVLGPSGARAPPAVGGALHVRGLRRRPPPGRRGAAERPLPGRHPPERRDHGPPHLRRGREHPRPPRGAGPLGGRRRHGARELLGPLDQHLPGGGADPADQDPRAGGRSTAPRWPCSWAICASRRSAKATSTPRSVHAGSPSGGSAGCTSATGPIRSTPRSASTSTARSAGSGSGSRSSRTGATATRTTSSTTRRVGSTRCSCGSSSPSTATASWPTSRARTPRSRGW